MPTKTRLSPAFSFLTRWCPLWIETGPAPGAMPQTRTRVRPSRSAANGNRNAWNAGFGSAVTEEEPAGGDRDPGPFGCRSLTSNQKAAWTPCFQRM